MLGDEWSESERDKVKRRRKKNSMCKACSFVGNENDHAEVILFHKLLEHHVDYYLNVGEDEVERVAIRPRLLAKRIAHGMHSPSKNSKLRNVVKTDLANRIAKMLIEKGWTYDPTWKYYVKVQDKSMKAEIDGNDEEEMQSLKERAQQMRLRIEMKKMKIKNEDEDVYVEDEDEHDVTDDLDELVENVYIDETKDEGFKPL